MEERARHLGLRDLGRPLADEVLRGRLIDRLAERWNTRLVTLCAPGGYGKSIALAQAVRDNAEDPTGVDVYARCRPGLDGQRRVVADVFEALSGTGNIQDDGVEQLCAAVREYSPQEVSLVIDDVHAVDDDRAFAELIQALLDRLPQNGHVVLAGRTMPNLKVARLRARDDLIDIGASDLAFQRAEVEQVARHHNVPVDRLDVAEGWPAVTRLLVVSGRASSTDFMIEEVLEQLSSSQRLALAVAIVAAPAEPELLETFVTDVAVSDLVTAIPLLSEHGDGSLAAHDLWHEMVDAVVRVDELQRIAGQIVERSAAAGKALAAVDTAVRYQLWDMALTHIMGVFVEFDLNVGLTLLDRWLAVLPTDRASEPAYRFLVGVRSRLAGEVQSSTEDIRSAADGFETHGDIEAETTAVVELGLRSWMLNDKGLWAETFRRSQRIIDAGGQRMAQTSAMGRVVEAELRGDFAGALAEYSALPERDEIALSHATTLSLLVGQPDRALEFVAERHRRFPGTVVAAVERAVKWDAGQPDPVLEMELYLSPMLDNSRDLVRGVFIESMIEGSLGRPPDGDRVASLAWDRSRERTFAALVHAASDLLVHDEQRAGARFEAALAEIGHDDLLLRGEVRRFLPYGYLLSATCRAWLDDDPNLGPLQLELRSLARTLRSARQGTPIGELPERKKLLTWLPLPWSIEIAAHLAAHGDHRGQQLLDYLSDVTGAASHRELRRVRAAHRSLASAVDVLLATIPAPPIVTTHISVCEDFAVRHGDDPIEISRARVRQLIGLLTLRSTWGRAELAEMLWPGDAGKARINLRATLKHVRQALEPQRVGGEASFHLRQRDDRVWLQRSEFLVVDVWELDTELDRIRQAQAQGLSDQADLAAQRCVDLWGADPYGDLADLDDVADEIEHRRQAVLRAGASVAERFLAEGNAVAALDMTARLFDFDEHFERAHDVAIGAQLSLGDMAAAGEAVEAARASMSEHGVAPSNGTEMLIRRYERRMDATAPRLSAVDLAGS